MGEIIDIHNEESMSSDVGVTSQNQFDLVSVSEDMLSDVRSSINSKTALCVPIVQVATLGAGVSSLIPALRTVTQTTTMNTQGLYQLANKGVGDVLKKASDGTNWGAFKTSSGSSKFVKLQEAGPLSSTTQTVAAINPATMMMAAALFSIEQHLGKIEEMEKQILTFLESEKESEIEADLESLVGIINKYKHNWDNERFVSGNHKLVLDIQRTARKNMLGYQKRVNDALASKQLIVVRAKVNSSLKELLKKFQYYRLSLYIYSLASLLEIMLSENYKEENIISIQREIEQKAFEYREAFTKCSAYLERVSDASIEKNILSGVGKASKAIGKVIGSIPVVKEGQVDEFLQDKGEKIRNNAQEMEENVIDLFAKISNPCTGVFIEKINDLNRIYNHTSNICIDRENIYLLAE